MVFKNSSSPKVSWSVLMVAPISGFSLNIEYSVYSVTSIQRCLSSKVIILKKHGINKSAVLLNAVQYLQ